MKVNTLLTPKQKGILDFIQFYSVNKGFTPSYREIALQFSLKSEGSVSQYLDVLEEKGFLKRGEGSRQIILQKHEETVELPLLGTIAAGNPIEPVETPLPISVPKSMIPTSGMCYALKIKGDSMIDDGIADEDIVLIKHQQSANNGDTVVAITEDGATLKRFYNDNGIVRLEPRNPDLKIIYPKHLEIKGKFIGLIRHGV